MQTITATHEQHRSNDMFIAAAINEKNKVGPFGLNKKKIVRARHLQVVHKEICKALESSQHRIFRSSKTTLLPSKLNAVKKLLLLQRSSSATFGQCRINRAMHCQQMAPPQHFEIHSVGFASGTKRQAHHTFGTIRGCLQILLQKKQ